LRHLPSHKAFSLEREKYMRRKKFFAPSLAFILGGLLFAVPAGALTINDINDDFTINWFLAKNGSDNDGGVTAPFDLKAQATFDITAISNNSVTLLITFTNQTTPPPGQNSGITSFGIGVSPNATGVTFSDAPDAGFTNAVKQNGQQNYPGGFKQIDVCVFTQGCSGGGQPTALAAGASDTFTLVIAGAFTGHTVTLTPFPIKFQTSAGSFEFAGTEGINPTPEPGTVLLLSSGLIGLGLTRWCKRTTLGARETNNA
jgi:hypothetical protein